MAGSGAYDTTLHHTSVHKVSDRSLNNGTGGADKTPLSLRVVIIGAGIGGLTAAIALRRHGHQVLVLEQSQFAQEIGAAIHIAPNANGILRRLGIKAEDFGSVVFNRYSEYNQNGERTRSRVTTPEMWQNPWHLSHRGRLHNVLREVATNTDGPGQPAQLRLSSRVARVNCSDGIVTLKDGTEHVGDVIVGADGVHSVARREIPGWKSTPFDSGKSAFRFMIPRSAVAEDPATSKYAPSAGELLLFFGSDRRIVIYPTNNNQELNFGCIYPSKELNTGDDWNNDTTVGSMLKIYRTWDSSILALISKADPATLKSWTLLDMDKLPTFVNGRMALMGDAAHPFLPHQAQGAGSAIEDAASLTVMLSNLTSTEEIRDRLELYNEARYSRVHLLQNFTRLVGLDEKDRLEPVDVTKYTNINCGHDEWHYSSQRLREWLWSRQPTYWRQPIAFGPMPGPRQTHLGEQRNGQNQTFTTASIKFKTSQTLLENLFPPGRKGWSFQAHGTIAYASISQTTLNKMEWLGGSGYNHLGLYIHGVQYTKEDGSVTKGSYLPILFENLTDPIVSGREELGMPKLFSSIDVHRRESSYYITTSWQGAVWGNFRIQGLEKSDPSKAPDLVSSEVDDGYLMYRYIPAVGRELKGTAVEEFPVFIPTAAERPVPKIERCFEAKRADFDVNAMNWDALPTLHHIIERLAELPVYEVISAKVVEGTGVPDVASAVRVE